MLRPRRRPVELRGVWLGALFDGTALARIQLFGPDRLGEDDWKRHVEMPEGRGRIDRGVQRSVRSGPGSLEVHRAEQTKAADADHERRDISAAGRIHRGQLPGPAKAHVR